MSFWDRLKGTLTGGGASSGRSKEAAGYWIYAKCRRCGEPLKAHIDMRNEPSQGEDGDTWVVRKGLIGDGSGRFGGMRCFQTVEVTLTFDSSRQNVIDQEVSGGELITEEEYEALLAQPPAEAENTEESSPS
jgi:hypothetical protein